MVSTCSCRAITASESEPGIVEVVGFCESEYIATGKYFQVVVRLTSTRILSGRCVCFSTLRAHGYCKHISCLLHTILLLQERPSDLPKWARRSQRTVRMLRKSSLAVQNKHRLWESHVMYEKFVEPCPEGTVLLTTQQVQKKRGRPRAQTRSGLPTLPTSQVPSASPSTAPLTPSQAPPPPERRILRPRANRNEPEALPRVRRERTRH
jgi:hypothetical protein